MISECITFPVQLNLLYVCVMKICHGNPCCIRCALNNKLFKSGVISYEFKPGCQFLYMPSELCYIGDWPEKSPAPLEFWHASTLMSGCQVASFPGSPYWGGRAWERGIHSSALLVAILVHKITENTSTSELLPLLPTSNGLLKQPIKQWYS